MAIKTDGWASSKADTMTPTKGVEFSDAYATKVNKQFSESLSAKSVFGKSTGSAKAVFATRTNK